MKRQRQDIWWSESLRTDYFYRYQTAKNGAEQNKTEQDWTEQKLMSSYLLNIYRGFAVRLEIVRHEAKN